MSENRKPDDCCRQFNPEVWDEKVHHWQNKLFIKDSISQFLHLPLPGAYKRCIKRLSKLANDAAATPEKTDFLFLSHDPSPWKSDLYMLVSKEVAGAENVQLSGSFISKVFDGRFSKIPQYIRDMDIYLAKQNKLAVKYYFYFATCPECEKKYGHNYMVAFAEV